MVLEQFHTCIFTTTAFDQECLSGLKESAKSTKSTSKLWSNYVHCYTLQRLQTMKQDTLLLVASEYRSRSFHYEFWRSTGKKKNDWQFTPCAMYLKVETIRKPDVNGHETKTPSPLHVTQNVNFILMLCMCRYCRFVTTRPPRCCIIAGSMASWV